MSVFTADPSHSKDCGRHYGAVVETGKPCVCGSLPAITVRSGELQQMAGDGRGRASVVRELAKLELARRKL